MNPKQEPALNSYTHPITPKESDTLKDLLENQGFIFSEKPYTVYAAANKSKKVNVSVYTSGKLLIQGKGTKEFIEFVLEPLVFKKIEIGYQDIVQKPTEQKDGYKEKIGCDESGKGDYFGPLVVAAAYLKSENLQKIRDLGVQDSKKITDKKISSIYPKLIKFVDYETLILMPEKYNELFAKMKNLNRILAWSHATAIENLYKKVNCKNILLDKFAKEYLVQNLIDSKLPGIKITQRTKAESDPAVAAASIIARQYYLTRLKQLGEEYGVTLPKGAGRQVDEAGSVILKNHPPEILAKVAKTHFKNTQKIPLI